MILRTLAMLSIAFSAGTAAAQNEGCLTAAQQRAAIGEGRAVPLAQATRAAKARHNGDVVNARLCAADGRLSYFLTIVDKQGKVMRAVIDAKSADVVQLR